MKRVLFSPIGSTDPITGQHDGALLHIVRCLDIDEIYLFLSQEMCELDEKDNRYMYCLEQLAELTGHTFVVHKIMRPELKEVQVFDTIFSDFRNIIGELSKRLERDDELYLNVSSGTPAMKSALQVIATFAERKMIPVQVSTPSKAYNEHREDVKGDYDVELQWEMNLDNQAGFEPRWTVSSNINLAAEIKKNIIKNLVNSFDYVAALDIAKGMPDFIDETVIYLIHASAARVKQDKENALSYSRKAKYRMLPYWEGSECEIVEALVLSRIKIKKEEYADFLRGISPLLFSVIERLIRQEAGMDLDRYYTQWRGMNGTSVKYWDLEKAKTDPVLAEILTRGGKNELRQQVVYTASLVKLLEKRVSDQSLVDKVVRMRKIEEKVRNPVAHCLTYVTEDVIKAETGLPAMEIFKLLKELVIRAGIKVSDEDLHTYERCNTEIIRRLNFAETSLK